MRNVEARGAERHVFHDVTRAAMAVLVEGDGGDDDRPGDDLLHPDFEPDLRAAVVDRRHQQRAGDSAEDRADAAGGARAADDGGGDDAELAAARWSRSPTSTKLNCSTPACRWRAAQDSVEFEFDAFDVDAARNAAVVRSSPSRRCGGRTACSGGRRR